MNYILAATDLSAPARHAVERAALASRETGAQLGLLHVANLAPLERLRHLMQEPPESLQQRVQDVAREKMRELAEALSTRFGVVASIRVVQGSVLAELTKEVDAVAADLVVCGAKGESFMRHVALGSTAERILGRTKSPVLVVKQVVHEHYRRVLVPVDFTDYSLRAVQLARRIAPAARLTLLHAFEMPFEGRLRYANVDNDILNHYRVVGRQEVEQKMVELIVSAGLSLQSVDPMVLNGDPASRILEYEQELNCDLIVMGKQGNSLVEEFFLGSETKHVLAESQCDVLVST